jgi:hypothetical protein
VPSSTPSSDSTSTWQTVATVLLVVHLFCLAIAIASNVGGRASPAARRLRSVPGVIAYLQMLGMDLAYEFPLATAAPNDAPHHLELRQPAASQTPLAELPAPQMGSLRRQRYQQLAAYVVDFDETFAENPDLRTQLPLAIAQAWIKRLELPPDRYTLVCRQKPLPRLETSAPPQASRDESQPQTPVTVELVWSPAEGRYQGLVRQEAGLTSRAVEDSSQP